MNDVSCASDFRWILFLERAGSDFIDFRNHGILFPVAGDRAVTVGQKFDLINSVQSADNQCAQVTAGIDRCGGAVGGQGAFARFFDGISGITCIEHGHWGQSHDGAIACAMNIGGTTEWIAGLQKGGEGRRGNIANVKTCPSAAQVAFLPPANIPFHLIFGIEALAFNQAFGEAKCHRGVVGPLTWLQVEGSAADHVGDRCEASRRFEFQGRTQGIAHGQS